MRSTSLLVSGLAGTLALVLSSGVGCRGSDNGSTPDTNNGGGDKIQDVQNDAMAPGTAVNLKGVVVTAVDTFGAKTGDFWVEEPEGGLNSGILIFNKANAIDVSALVPGDIVNVTGGVKEEFALSSDTSGNTDTEIGPPTGDNGDVGAVVQRYIKRYRDRIGYCYERELLAKPDLAGTVNVAFLLNADGAVLNATADGVDPAVSSCIGDVVRNIKFPRLADSGTFQIKYPFILHAPNK